MPRIIPVLDVMGGQAVRAVGGRREMYAPVKSRLTPSTEPLLVARALLAAAKVNELYVAEIDALMGHRPRLGWLKELADAGCRVMVDSGLKTAADAIAIAAVGASVVVGTETLGRFEELQALVHAWDADRVYLSIDLRNGRVLGSEAAWGIEPSVETIIEKAMAVGIKRFLVLELARVGTGVGPGTVELCTHVRQRFPDIELLAGGGVRNWQDVDALGAAGADGVLVASALHDGAISAAR
ncbi:MAG TPA: HisA/HisF-related TIM barrel protein [Urbifossiella sp.]|nr:HisA/HisF-related TIM barrel protein [Urbifossiella sp.]